MTKLRRFPLFAFAVTFRRTEGRKNDHYFGINAGDYHGVKIGGCYIEGRMQGFIRPLRGDTLDIETRGSEY